jgi:hypothetical protein
MWLTGIVFETVTSDQHPFIPEIVILKFHSTVQHFHLEMDKGEGNGLGPTIGHQVGYLSVLVRQLANDVDHVL